MRLRSPTLRPSPLSSLSACPAVPSYAPWHGERWPDRTKLWASPSSQLLSQSIAWPDQPASGCGLCLLTLPYELHWNCSTVRNMFHVHQAKMLIVTDLVLSLSFLFFFRIQFYDVIIHFYHGMHFLNRIWMICHWFVIKLWGLFTFCGQCNIFEWVCLIDFTFILHAYRDFRLFQFWLTWEHPIYLFTFFCFQILFIPYKLWREY